MKTIQVTASSSYEVLIDTGLLSQAGSILKSICKTKKIAIISDDHVFPLYGKQLIHSLESQEFNVCYFIFPSGEQSKNIGTYSEILSFLASNNITRYDLVIALGGGVVGDITGFAAATYLRGVDYVQIPTTLLAMVDSSVGGKTAIDLPVGKNLVGAFYQPKLVLCDIDCLKSLPLSVFQDGCAEVIKYGILYDVKLFNHLAQEGLEFDKLYVIGRCIELKRDVVAADEFDRDERQKLNLGHTFGHGIEAISNYEISHGQAVAAGMAIIARAANGKRICSDDTCNQIIQILDKFQLPTSTAYSAEDLYTFSLSDKKRNGDSICLVIPTSIGHCILLPTNISEVKSFIEAGK